MNLSIRKQSKALKSSKAHLWLSTLKKSHWTSRPFWTNCEPREASHKGRSNIKTSIARKCTWKSLIKKTTKILCSLCRTILPYCLTKGRHLFPIRVRTKIKSKNLETTKPLWFPNLRPKMLKNQSCTTRSSTSNWERRTSGSSAKTNHSKNKWLTIRRVQESNQKKTESFLKRCKASKSRKMPNIARCRCSPFRESMRSSKHWRKVKEGKVKLEACLT